MGTIQAGMNGARIGAPRLASRREGPLEILLLLALIAMAFGLDPQLEGLAAFTGG